MQLVQEDRGRIDVRNDSTVAEFLLDVGHELLHPAGRLTIVEGAEVWQVVLAVDMWKHMDIALRATVEGWTMDRIRAEVAERKQPLTRWY